MVTSAMRRQAALDAIAAVLVGAVAGDAETELVDFKLEDSRWDHRAAAPREIGPQSDAAAIALAREAACLANNPTKGGVLVVGIHDKMAGPGALIGACSDATWLRRRIFALTQPSLNADVEEIYEGGVRLLLVNVPDALGEIYADGKLRTRVGTDCVELTGDAARHFLEERRGFDWSAQPSGLRLSSATPDAIESAVAHYQRKNGTTLGARELALRLKVLLDQADPDPELTNAGALLLCEFEPGRDQIDLLVTVAEGAASSRRINGPAPVMPLYDRVMLALLDDIFPGRNEIVGGREPGRALAPGAGPSRSAGQRHHAPRLQAGQGDDHRPRRRRPDGRLQGALPGRLPAGGVGQPAACDAVGGAQSWPRRGDASPRAGRPRRRRHRQHVPSDASRRTSRA